MIRTTDRTGQQSLPRSKAASGVGVMNYDLLSPVPETGAVTLFQDLIGVAVPCDYDGGTTCPVDFADERAVLSWLCLLAVDSPTAGPLLIEATETGWHVGFAALGNNGYYIDTVEKTLLLDRADMTPATLARSPYFRNALIFSFMKALRDIWHEEGLEPFEPCYRPEDILMLERMRSADCDCVALLIGWELRGAGYGDLWRHLIGAAEGDMALVFSQFLERDPAALFSGTALAYALRQWFSDQGRVDACDHDTLEHMDDMMALSAQHNPFGKSRITAAAIEAMGALPDGSNYLEGLGETIRVDPFFMGLNDPINQTHLLQITYDLSVTMVCDVPFRDATLARKIFPENPRRTLVE